MNGYYFESREFGVSDNGIHLLRSGFNYETIEFSQVDSLIIERGKDLNNWLAILVIGLALVSFAIYYSFGLFDVFDGGTGVRVIYIEEILVPLGPFLLGGYCVYSSLKNGTVMRVRTRRKVEKLSLREFEKEDRLGPLQKFLSEKLHTKVRMSV